MFWLLFRSHACSDCYLVIRDKKKAVTQIPRWGVPPLRGVGLSATSPAQGPHTKASPGFPLLSLTQASNSQVIPLWPCHAEVTKHLIHSIDTLSGHDGHFDFCVRDRSGKPGEAFVCGPCAGLAADSPTRRRRGTPKISSHYSFLYLLTFILLFSFLSFYRYKGVTP